MKPQKIIFYGSDAATAKQLAAKFREQGFNAVVRDAMAFRGEKEAGELVLMPCVALQHAQRIALAYSMRDPLETSSKPPVAPVDVRRRSTLTLHRGRKV